MTDVEQGVAGDTGRNPFWKKDRIKRHKLLLKEHLYDYGSVTTLHGLRYVTDRRLSVFEKIFWSIIFLMSIALCIYRIQLVWIKWKESPVIMTFNERLEPVGRVPFPSVTICPQVKVKPEKFNYTDVRTKYLQADMGINNTSTISKKNKKILADVSILCQDVLAYSFSEIRYSNVSLVKNILEVAPNINDLLMECHWHNKTIIDCDKIFKTVLTQEGVCFNMNSLPAHEILNNNSIQHDYEYLTTLPNETVRGWTEDGYYDSTEENPYPRRGSANTIDFSIAFYQAKILDDKTCNSFNTGFKVYIQDPRNMPRSSIHYYAVSPKMLSSFAIKFNILSSAENLRSISSDVRKCFFSDERKLRYFKIYTASNCELECLSQLTYELCGCVGFYMPHESSEKICTFSNYACMSQAAEKMTRDSCDCLPSCDSIQYEAEIFKSDFKLKEYLIASFTPVLGENVSGETFEREGGEFSSLQMYYKEPSYITMRRSQLFGNTEFLANCGGLLGLFLGFSFLSLVEIIYFITLRLWCSLKRVRKEEKHRNVD